MTTHLSSQEFVDALDGRLTAPRQTHLEGCAACRAQAEELGMTLEAAADDASLPEPSPLFWDHFHARVVAAAQSEGQADPLPWWRRWPGARPLLAVSAAVIVLAAGIATYVKRPSAPIQSAAQGAEVSASDFVADPVPLDNEEWEFVSSVIGTLEADDIHTVLAPSRHAVDSAMETLSVAEREAFVKLLKAEMSQGLE